MANWYVTENVERETLMQLSKANDKEVVRKLRKTLETLVDEITVEGADLPSISEIISQHFKRKDFRCHDATICYRLSEVVDNGYQNSLVYYDDRSSQTDDYYAHIMLGHDDVKDLYLAQVNLYGRKEFLETLPH